MKMRSLALAVLLAGTQLAAQDAAQIVEKALEALGGVQKLKSIESRKLSGEILLAGGMMTGQFVLYQNRPDNMRIEVEANGEKLVQGHDGQEAWQILPMAFGGSGQPEALTGKAAENILRTATFDSPLVDYATNGAKIELVGKEQVGEHEAFHLKLTQKDSSIVHYFLDTSSYLNLKTVRMSFNPQSGSDIETEQWASDYKEVDGVMIPHTLETRTGGQTVSEFKVGEIEFNGKQDGGLFKRPTS